MRCDERHFLARRRHVFLLGVRDLGIAEQSLAGDAVEHAVARELRLLGKAIGPAIFRRLRQRHEQRRFAEREPPRLLAEIGERGRADAFEIAAIRREREIKAEDLVLGERPFELERPHRLPDLGVERAVLARLEQAGDLHGERRAARDDAAMRDELIRRAHDGERIDAVMGEEPLVLIGEQRFEEDRVDLLARGRKPPAAFAGQIGPEQLAVAIEHQRRDFEIAPERRRPERLEHARRCRRRSRQRATPRRSPRRSARRSPQHAASLPSPRRGEGSAVRGALNSVLIWRGRPPPRRSRCGRSGQADTCPRPPPAAAHSFRETPPARHRPPCRWSDRRFAARTPP